MRLELQGVLVPDRNYVSVEEEQRFIVYTADGLNALEAEADVGLN